MATRNNTPAQKPEWSATTSYTPTILLGALPDDVVEAVCGKLQATGWDIRSTNDFDVDLRGDSSLQARWLVGTAATVQPDVMVTMGSQDDPWALKTIVELRSDPATHDLGLIVIPDVTVPDDMQVVPMSGPDGWVFRDDGTAQAVETIRQAALAAMDGRLNWAHREWTDTDRRRDAIKGARVRVEQGRQVDAAAMSEWLYGRRNLVDVKIWEEASPHRPGWRFGRARYFRRPLLVYYDAPSDEDLTEQCFTLFARSGRLLLAACHAISDLAGGWPSLEML